MRNFQNTFETRKQSFVSAFSICMTAPLIYFTKSESFLSLYIHQCERSFITYSSTDNFLSPIPFSDWLTHSCHWSLLIPPENIRKPLVFWYFQRVSKEICDMKWVNILLRKFDTSLKKMIRTHFFNEKQQKNPKKVYM